MAEGINYFVIKSFLATGTFRRLKFLKRFIQRMGRIVQYVSGFRFQCCIVCTGQVFMFVTNYLANCVDNMSKRHFIIVTDITIPCIQVQEDAL